MIRATGLRLLYPGGGGVRDAGFSLEEGASLSILGPSGCGKSTLVHMLAGLLTPQAGTLDYGGFSDAAGTQNGAGVLPRTALVQQKNSLFPWLTINENLLLAAPASLSPSATPAGSGAVEDAYSVRVGRSRGSSRSWTRRAQPGRITLIGSGLHSASRRRQRDQARELMERLNIGHCAERYPGSLSGGERQRAEVARALMGRPQLLLFDEPGSALDEFNREALQDLLLEIQQERKISAVYITHSIEEALFLGSELALMVDGEIRKMVQNPLFPDPGARLHRDFYASVISVRELLRSLSSTPAEGRRA